MSRRLVVGITILALVAGVVGVTQAAQLHTEQPVYGEQGSQLAQDGEQEIRPFLQDGQEFDRTIFRVEVFENGDTRWALEQHRQIPLDDEEEIDRFETFAAEFTSTETEAFENFQLRAQRLTQQGSNVTDREMNASAFRRDAYYQDRLQRGVVKMSFRWSGFAPVADQTVTVADVLEGFALLEEQRLEIQAGGNLTMQSVTPEPDSASRGESVENESVLWRGPQNFEDSLEVVLVPESAVENSSVGGDSPTNDGDGTAGGDAENTDSGADGEQNGQSNMLVPMLAAFVLVLGVGGGAAWYTLARSRTEPAEDAGVTTDAPDAPDASAEQSTPEPAGISEQELLSDEDLVIQLLEENGGRMRQVSIVEETDWSKSKVSMLLSDMEDDGEISKLRVGRENIVSIAGEEPEAAGSPFETDSDQ